MTRAIDLIRPIDLDLICPGHGPVHRQNLKKAMDLSESYANDYLKLVVGRTPKNILIAYVSAYGYTRQAAEYIADGIQEAENVRTEILDIENLSIEMLESKIITADGILIGSPTINQNTLLPVYKLFSQINPIRDKGKLGGAYGSYGWSGESPKIILENLRLLKLKVFEDTAHFKFSPSGDKADFLRDFGRRYARKFKEECGT
jgi:flavorubredoxin